MALKSPGVEVRETVQSGGGSSDALLTRAAFVGTAERGPVGTAVLIVNLTQFVETFGGGGSKLRRAADAVFTPGNAPGAQAYFVRTAHYTDPGVASTLTAVKATTTVKAGDNTTNAMQVVARTEGTWGNALNVTVTPGSPTTTWTLAIIESKDGVDTVLETYANVNLGTVQAAINGVSKYVTVTALVGASTTMGSVTQALTTGDDGLTSIADSDFVGSPAGRTGLNALNTVPGRLLVAIPGITSTTVQNGLLAWCGSRKDAYAYLDCPNGVDEIAARTHRTTTINANSSYGEIWWPNLMVTDPDGSLVEVPISPYRMAAQIRTDEAVGGAHQVASGAIYGGITGYTKPASDRFYDQSVRDLLDPIDVNTLNQVGGGVVFWGANTLDGTGTFPYSNERRVFQFCEAAVKENVLIEAFQNNDESLWKSLTRKIENVLLPVWRAGGLRGATPEAAFAIKIDSETNPQEAIDAGEVRGKIGLATQRPGLFFYFDFFKRV